jgi:hypothetical protein
MFEDVIESNLHVYNSGAVNAKKYRIDCPFCIDVLGSEDTHGHMHLFKSSWIGHCFRCGSRRHVKTILSKLGLSAPTISLDTIDIGSIVKRKLSPFLNSPEMPSEVDLPDGCHPFTSLPRKPIFERVFSTLESWNIQLETAQTLNWYWNIPRSSFIFPCYMFGKLVYYSLRNINGARLSCPGDFSKFGILNNLDNDLREVCSEVYIVEGAKDVAMFYQAGLWSVALMGHSLSSFQAYRLNELPHRKIVCLDSDVTNDAAEMAQSQGWEATYLPQGDPADWGSRLGDAVKVGNNLSSRVRQLLKNKQVDQSARKKPWAPS